MTVLYWDASAILPVLLEESRSSEAAVWAGSPVQHLVSTLGHAEVCAVLERMKRARDLTDVLVESAYEAFDSGPWEVLRDSPDPEVIRSRAVRWALRGADLWHLALALTLRVERPDLRVVTFDDRLRTASAGEDLLAS